MSTSTDYADLYEQVCNNDIGKLNKKNDNIRDIVNSVDNGHIEEVGEKIESNLGTDNTQEKWISGIVNSGFVTGIIEGSCILEGWVYGKFSNEIELDGTIPNYASNGIIREGWAYGQFNKECIQENWMEVQANNGIWQEELASRHINNNRTIEQKKTSKSSKRGIIPKNICPPSTSGDKLTTGSYKHRDNSRIAQIYKPTSHFNKRIMENNSTTSNCESIQMFSGQVNTTVQSGTVQGKTPLIIKHKKIIDEILYGKVNSGTGFLQQHFRPTSIVDSRQFQGFNCGQVKKGNEQNGIIPVKQHGGNVQYNRLPGQFYNGVVQSHESSSIVNSRIVQDSKLSSSVSKEIVQNHESSSAIRSRNIQDNTLSGNISKEIVHDRTTSIVNHSINVQDNRLSGCKKILKNSKNSEIVNSGKVKDTIYSEQVNERIVTDRISSKINIEISHSKRAEIQVTNNITNTTSVTTQVEGSEQNSSSLEKSSSVREGCIGRKHGGECSNMINVCHRENSALFGHTASLINRLAEQSINKPLGKNDQGESKEYKDKTSKDLAKEQPGCSARVKECNIQEGDKKCDEMSAEEIYNLDVSRILEDTMLMVRNIVLPANYSVILSFIRYN